MSAAVPGAAPDEERAASVPGTKAARHVLIAQILSRSRVRSQAELRDALALRGVTTTQATLSRDLVELRATKIRTASGGAVYSLPKVGAPGQVEEREGRGSDSDALADHVTSRLARWCTDLLVAAEMSGSQVVLRTPAGAAQLLAGAVDDAMMPGVLGCIAGDDTVLVITRGEEVSAELVSLLLALAEPATRH